MKKLAICGDSFSAISKTLPGTHFSEILSARLNWKLINMARRGCSNGGIRLQIGEAIKQNADYVIIVPTGWDRMELPVRDNFYDGPKDVIKEFGNFLQDFLQDTSKSCYDPSAGIGNINYDPDAKNLIFETIFSLAENYPHEYRKAKLAPEKVEAVKQFINHIYDSCWKQQIDKWLLSEGCSQLSARSIPFSIERGMLWKDKNDVLSSLPASIDKKYVREDNQLIGTGTSLYPLKDTSKDPGYHSEPEGQVWIADLYEKIINET